MHVEAAVGQGRVLRMTEVDAMTHAPEFVVAGPIHLEHDQLSGGEGKNQPVGGHQLALCPPPAALLFPQHLTIVEAGALESTIVESIDGTIDDGRRVEGVQLVPDAFVDFLAPDLAAPGLHLEAPRPRNPFALGEEDPAVDGDGRSKDAISREHYSPEDRAILGAAPDDLRAAQSGHDLADSIKLLVDRRGGLHREAAIRRAWRPLAADLARQPVQWQKHLRHYLRQHVDSVSDHQRRRETVHIGDVAAVAPPEHLAVGDPDAHDRALLDLPLRLRIDRALVRNEVDAITIHDRRRHGAPPFARQHELLCGFRFPEFLAGLCVEAVRPLLLVRLSGDERTTACFHHRGQGRAGLEAPEFPGAFLGPLAQQADGIEHRVAVPGDETVQIGVRLQDLAGQRGFRRIRSDA